MGDFDKHSGMGKYCGEGKNMNIFTEMVHSVYDLKGYGKFLKNGKRRTFLYGFLLSLLYILVSFVLPTAASVAASGGIESLLEESVPEFTLKDGKLRVAEPVEYTLYDNLQGGIYIRIDTENAVTQEITEVDLVAFEKAVVMDADHVLLKTNGEIVRASYEDLSLGDWNRETLFSELLPFARVLLGALSAVVILSAVIGFFAGAFFTAALGSVIGSILKYRLDFSDLFKLAVHARTAPILIKAVLAWSPVWIPFSLVLNFGISAVYMWKAISDIKRNHQGPAEQSYWTGDI